jgi:hypothetical protein
MRAKDFSKLKEADVAITQRDKKGGVVRDYTLQHRVEICWDLNAEAERDMMFRLKVDDLEVILDAEEVQRYLRWV